MSVDRAVPDVSEYPDDAGLNKVGPGTYTVADDRGGRLGLVLRDGWRWYGQCELSCAFLPGRRQPLEVAHDLVEHWRDVHDWTGPVPIDPLTP